MTKLTLPEREAALLAGRFGDSAEIRRLADPFYDAVGLPPGTASAADLHPWAEYQAEQAALGQRAAGTVSDLRCPVSPPDGWQPEIERRLGHGVELDLAPADAGAVDAGVAALLADLPAAAADALSYVRAIAVTGHTRVVGVTWTDMAGLVVISRPTLADPADASDCLFHEALHSKMAIIERGLAEPFLEEPDTVAAIPIPWRYGDDARWTTHRAFDAFHVYAHLTVLWAHRRARGADVAVERRLRRVCFRAEYLSRRLRACGYADLGGERAALAGWLDGIRLPAFGLSPAGRAALDAPPAGARFAERRIG
jgi:hypothetical protein